VLGSSCSRSDACKAVRQCADLHSQSQHRRRRSLVIQPASTYTLAAHPEDSARTGFDPRAGAARGRHRGYRRILADLSSNSPPPSVSARRVATDPHTHGGVLMTVFVWRYLNCCLSAEGGSRLFVSIGSLTLENGSVVGPEH